MIAFTSYWYSLSKHIIPKYQFLYKEKYSYHFDCMSSRKRKTSQMCAGCIVRAVDIELQLIMLKYWNEYKTDVKLNIY